MPSATTPLRAAVVLCGSGRADGSEIHESVSILTHCARLGIVYQCFAPDQSQSDTVNHLTGKPEGPARNCLVEAARIARGNILPLAELQADGYDLLFFPGGFGAAKNLCTFASQGDACTTIADVERVLRAFHAAGKPIGLACIAPVLAARVFGKAAGGPGVTITLGAPGPSADAAMAMGATHRPLAVTEACTDQSMRIITTPAYMDDEATPWQVFTGIGKLVDAAAALATKF